MIADISIASVTMIQESIPVHVWTDPAFAAKYILTYRN